MSELSIITMATEKLESLAGVWLSNATFARVWPLSKTSLPNWGCAMGLLMISWFFNFVVIKKPDAIRRDEEKRGKYYREMMGAVLAYSTKEDLKSEEDRKRPEASRVYKLLWDDVHKVRTTKYGIAKDDDVNVDMEKLLQRLLVHELQKAIKYTVEANQGCDRDATDATSGLDATAHGKEISVSAADDKTEPPSKDEIKTIAEHKSGDKLHRAIRFNKEVRKNMGKRFVDTKLIKKAQAICKELYNKQSKKANSVLMLVGPVVPHAIKMIIICCLRTALCAKFHQIGVWVNVIEVGAGGDMPQAVELLFELWLGHMFIKLLNLPEHTYRKRAKSMFGSRIRNGVLAAMVRQDYEYFDKNSTGVLQERLNRDADELGDNLIGFPQEMLEKLTWISVNMYIVYHQCPWGLFTVAIWPVIIMMTFQFFMFRYFRSCEERMRRVGQEGVRVTSEVLRQIKTVRQFAMEPQSAAEFARSNISRHMMVEQVHVVTELARTFVWSLFDSGIALTILFGLPYVASGQMSTAALIDTFCKINFNICFCLREFLEKLPKAAELLQPLGRICDLLDSTSLIEPNKDPAFVDVGGPEDLIALLSMCEVDNRDCENDTSIEELEGHCCVNSSRYYRRPARTVAAAPIVSGKALYSTEETTLIEDVNGKGKGKGKGKPVWGRRGTGVLTGPGAKKGAQLLSLTTADHRYITVENKATIDPHQLTYPVRATFSTKLRPARFRGKIEFRNVSFCYPTELRTPVLQGMSFVVEPGQKVALVGATGCGKSSCMALLQRLYDPQEGTILIDDIPLQDYDIHFLRSRIVIVDQHTVLFTATIRDNITYGMGEGVTDEMVIQACKDAKAWDFIDDKPDKLLTMISSGGSNLSGGQRQRLAIARAMIRRPDVILLDEATSALDNTNETLVQQALDKLMKNGSALVIAHRLSTIRDSDKIIVVDHGKNAEEGTHDALLAEAPSTPSTTDASAQDPSNRAGESVDEAGRSLARIPSGEIGFGGALGLNRSLDPAESDGAEQDSDDASTSPSYFSSAPGDLNQDATPVNVTNHDAAAVGLDTTDLPPPPATNPTLGRAKTSHGGPAQCGTPAGRASGLTWVDLSKGGGQEEGMTYRKLWDAATGVKSGQSLESMMEKITTMEAQLKEYRAKVAVMKDQKHKLLNGLDLYESFDTSDSALPARAPGLARAISSQ